MPTVSPPLDPILLSGLLSSRLCHDLINPVGALGSGLEVLADEGMDESMKEAAIDLIRSGGEKSIALLKYARLAYGAAGGRGAELPMEEAENALKELYAWSKADIVWRLPPGNASKERVKTVLILAHTAADCVPRGGTVTVSGTSDDFIIKAEGPRAMLHDDLLSALRGETEDLKPKLAPAYIAGLLARESGGDIAAELDGERVYFRVNFAGSAAFAASR